MTRLIEANAGTGKTYSIIDSILRDILGRGIRLNKILALTFTNKAANELRHRLASRLLEHKAENPGVINESLDLLPYAHIGTIHSFCTRFLKQNGPVIGLSPYFEVVSDTRLEQILSVVAMRHAGAFSGCNPLNQRDVWHFFKEIVRANLDPAALAREPHEPRHDLRDRIESLVAKEFGGKPSERILRFLLDFRPYKYRELKQLLYNDNCAIEQLLGRLTRPFNEALTYLKENGLVTYEMLISFTKEILRSSRDIREQEKLRYEKIYVDELQDTDPLQYEIILYLSEAAGEFSSDPFRIRLQSEKLCAVGDRKQAIYGFRGADIRNYEKFKRILGANKAEVSSLLTNRRSCPHIIKFSNDFALHNFGQGSQPSAPPDSHAHQCDGKGCLQLFVGTPDGKLEDRLIVEAKFIAVKARELGSAYGPKNTAILLRKMTNAHIIMSELNRAGVAFAIEGAKASYHQPEVTGLANILRLCVNPDDRVALLGVLRSLYMPLTDAEVYEFMSTGTVKSATLTAYVGSFINTIKELHDEIDAISTPDLLSAVFSQLPIFEAISSYPGAGVRIRNIMYLYEQSFKYSYVPCRQYVDKLLSNCLDASDEQDDSPSDVNSDAVKILSIHKSKGLEFDATIVSLTNYEGRGSEATDIRYDWLRNRHGLKCSYYYNNNYAAIIGAQSDPAVPTAVGAQAGLSASPASSAQIGDETSRELYVAFTRAKKQLIITDFSGGGKLISRIPDKYVKAAVKPDDMGATPPPRPSATLSLRQIEYGLHRDEPHEEDTIAMLEGSVVHYVLQHVDFSAPSNYKYYINRYLRLRGMSVKSLPPETYSGLIKTLKRFFSSRIFKWLASRKIISKEQSFSCLDGGVAKTRRIDLLLEDQDAVWIIDYKYSSKVNQLEMREYRKQLSDYAKVYRDISSKQVIKKGLILIKSSRLIAM